MILLSLRCSPFDSTSPSRIRHGRAIVVHSAKHTVLRLGQFIVIYRKVFKNLYRKPATKICFFAVHNKTSEQVRKFRTAVLSKPVKRELHQPHPTTHETPNLSDTSRTEDEKWIAQFVGKLQCPVCRKTFTRQAALSVHSAKCKPLINPEDGPQICNKCGKQFIRRNALRVHLQTCKNDLELETRTCKYCQKVFPKRRQLEIHSKRCPKANINSTPPKLILMQDDPSSPSDIQIRKDYKIPAYQVPRLSIPLEPLAGKLENVVQKLRERPLFCNETVSIKANSTPIKNEPLSSDKEEVLPIKLTPVFLVNLASDKTDERLNGDISDLSRTDSSRQDSCILSDENFTSDNECLPDATSPPFCGFDPIGFDDCYPREQIKALIKKLDAQLGEVALSTRNGIVSNNNHPPVNGVNKHMLFRFNLSSS